MEEKALFNEEELASANALLILKEVKEILEEKGYNAINQIVGYIISGDEEYISNYKDARKKVTSIERTDIVSSLLKEYLK